MNNLSLSDILRYLVIGIIILILSFICEPTLINKLYKTFGKVGIPFVAFSIGSITFLVYRATIYRLILFHILDCINKDNVRDKIMSEYNISNKLDAEIFWAILKRAKLSEEFKRIDFKSSEVHLLYMTSLMTFFAFIYLLNKYFIFLYINLLNKPYIFLYILYINFVFIIIIFLVFIVSGFAAICYDIQIEKTESKLYMCIHYREKDRLAKKLGYNKNSK